MVHYSMLQFDMAQTACHDPDLAVQGLRLLKPQYSCPGWCIGTYKRKTSPGERKSVCFLMACGFFSEPRGWQDLQPLLGVIYPPTWPSSWAGSCLDSASPRCALRFFSPCLPLPQGLLQTHGASCCFPLQLLVPQSLGSFSLGTGKILQYYQYTFLSKHWSKTGY